MELLIWLVIFVISLYALLKAAEWFGAAAVRVFGLGAKAELAAAPIAAALPELALALAAVLAGHAELAVPIVVGSSIANILLVAGAAAIAAKSLPVKREYVELDAPLLAVCLAIFYFVAGDGMIVFWEGALLAAAFLIYSVYLIARGGAREFTPRDLVTPGFLGAGGNIVEIVGARFGRGFGKAGGKNLIGGLFLALGAALLLAFSADFAIESLGSVAAIIMIPGVVLALAVLSVAGAVPELASTLEIVAKKKYEAALGNVFAGTIVNLFLVCGISAMFSPLPLGREALDFGLPFLLAAAGVLTVSAFSRKINAGQGLMYLFLYFLFLAKVFNLF